MSKPIDPELLKQIEETKRNMPPEEYAKLRERARQAVLSELPLVMPAFKALGVDVVCVDPPPPDSEDP